MFKYDIVAQQLARQDTNDRVVLDALASGDLTQLKKVITVSKLERICNGLGITPDNFMENCQRSADYRLGFNFYLAKDASKQKSIDEKNIFTGLDNALPDWTVEDLPNSGAGSVSLPVRKNTRISQKTIDGLIYNDSLFGLVMAKIIIGSGGSQTTTLKELMYYAEAKAQISREQIAQCVSHRYQLQQQQKPIFVLLVDTHDCPGVNDLLTYQKDDVWIVNHIQLQEKLNAYKRQETERSILYKAEPVCR